MAPAFTELLPCWLMTSKFVFLTSATKNEVTNSFLTLKNSRSIYPDGQQIKPINFIIDLICPILTHILNLFLWPGVFPRNVQIAKGLNLHKGGDVNNWSPNFRPISILPVFSKGLEKNNTRATNQLFLKKIILSFFQFGFRKKKSIEISLLTQKKKANS